MGGKFNWTRTKTNDKHVRTKVMRRMNIKFPRPPAKFKTVVEVKPVADLPTRRPGESKASFEGRMRLFESKERLIKRHKLRTKKIIA